ncbi:helix-turn-helix domain-containing protein [Aquabacterium sp. A7-Y]|uniref:GlxA family transcriptional regulator n=1 Tax=Aquabacterium sp. A7-Y TaxID=1349605 RepID=UPI00223CF973|nr:helix-turn-helix domain-containing protein [Aquabacterium sp. A7-Y]MCW7536743.1 helix-turn-helix domain-containing protein [Aquabacterium sp. A7-Y]
MHIALALVPGFLDASLGITLNIIQTANALSRAEGRSDAFRLSLHGPARGGVASASGLRVAVEPLREARCADVLVVPGALLESATAMEAWVAQPSIGRWIDAVRERHEAALPLAASCAGTWMLAEAGVLDGLRATTVWWLAAAFRRRYPRVQLDTDAIVVSEGHVITAGAAFAHTDLMLHLVSRWAGTPLAERCARLLLADLRMAQTRHTSLAWMAEADPLMRQACRWIDKHLSDPISVGALAAALHLTPRTLARRCHQTLGLSPWHLVQRRRVEASVELLRTTALPFEKIAARVGYTDASALRRLIRREMGFTPAGLRD